LLLALSVEILEKGDDKMKYFERFISNTYAGSANQHFFNMSEGEKRTGRIFYKISVGGKYNYSILYSNIIDSTYADGEKSHKNLICDSWIIHRARIGKCKSFCSDKDLSDIIISDSDEKADVYVCGFTDLLFNGKTKKEVMPGEFFASDPVELEFQTGEFLCLEITFSGKMIPYHEESLLPVYIKEGENWNYSKLIPFPGMIGCDRKVKGKVAYLGDSITQGIGTKANSYSHWNALLSKKLGNEYAYWNLGIGYGRANDAAADGAWLFKAKQNDIVFVCFGVNDILKGHTVEQIKADLASIVDILKKEDKKIVLQTIPPFDYTGENVEVWELVNDYIKTVLKDRVDIVFDVVPVLGNEEAPEKAKFGGHPDEKGCSLWTDALYEKLLSDFPWIV